MTLEPSDFKILICDDSVTNVMVLAKLCQSEGFTDTQTVTDPRKVVPLIEAQNFDLLMLDIEMPHMSGFDVMSEIRKRHADELLPILILTVLQNTDIRNRALAEGASDFLNKPFDQTEVILRVKNLLKVRYVYRIQQNLNQELEKKVQERTRELDAASEILVRRLAQVGEMRDKETGNHVIRVGQYASLLAELSGLPAEICYMMNKAAPLHDIGKVGVADDILLKPGKLDGKERVVMKTHAEKGAELLGDHDSLLMQLAASIAMHHHEKWDGSGYPRGIAGESIPIEGRITAISDVFDALTTQRPYKPAWPVEKAIAYLQGQSGKSFDPGLLKLFFDNLDKVMKIKEQYSDEKA